MYLQYPVEICPECFQAFHLNFVADVLFDAIVILYLFLTLELCVLLLASVFLFFIFHVLQ